MAINIDVTQVVPTVDVIYGLPEATSTEVAEKTFIEIVRADRTVTSETHTVEVVAS